MSAALTPPERARLIAILGRLGSDFDGERAAAGLLETRLLRDRGIDWGELLGAQPVGQPAQSAPACAAGRDSDLAIALAAFDDLTEWERGFIVSLRRRRRWTPRQTAVLRDIASKVGGM